MAKEGAFEPIDDRTRGGFSRAPWAEHLASARRWPPGVRSDLLVGPYLLLEKIGVGGTAEVHRVMRASDPDTESVYALKRRKQRSGDGKAQTAMLCSEARLLSLVSHPNIIDLVDFGVFDGDVTLVLEYVDGMSCGKLIGLTRAGVPPGAAWFVVDQILAALSYLHEPTPRRKGIVHRDVSPGNVLLSRAGQVKLIDFGISRCAAPQRQQLGLPLEGKPGYIAPEQMDGAVDPRSDLFSTGVVLAELLLGRRLFLGATPEATLARNYAVDLVSLDRHAARVPSWCRSILLRALAASPDARFPTAAQFRKELHDAAQRNRSAGSQLELAEWLRSLSG